VSRLPELTVSGSPFERGHAHGRAMGGVIRGFLADRLARINAVRPQPLALADARAIALCHAAVIETQLPAIAEEIAGLARGAEIDRADAYLLQIRRELIAHRDGDCSLIAGRTADGETVVAQTVDLPGAMTELGLILRVRDPHGPDVCMFTFAGLLGYLGLNEAGLAVGINMVLAPGWRVGVPPYLLVRHLLSLDGVAAATAAIERIPRASSRALLLADRHDVVDLELTVDTARPVRGAPLVHTNHFLDPALAAVDQLAEPSRSGSRARLARLRRHGDVIDLDALPALLADHDGYPRSVCAHGEGDLTRGETVAAVIMRPERGELRASRGQPCVAPFHTYTLAAP